MLNFVKFGINFPSSHSGNFKSSKGELGKFYPKFPSQPCDYYY